jgi:iron complex outermembrane recepter protein
MNRVGRRLQLNSPSTGARLLSRRLATVSALALAVAGAGAAAAQDTGAVEELVVTGSRLGRSGFTAPTPTTVIGATEMQSQAPVTIADVLNDLPSFRQSVSPRSASLNQSGAGASFLDLRGLGATRTLVLVNGRRHVASTASNNVDVSLIPSMLVDRVDVVTGGASAAYGSDAVAGVVNIITNTRLNGLRGTAQYGTTKEGDGDNYLFGLAGGTSFAGGKGHITIGGEYSNDDGIDSRGRQKREKWIQQRDRLTNAGWATNGQPAVIYARGVQYSNQFPGGVITGGAPANSPLIGTTFLDGGQTGRLTLGQVYGTNMIGGSQPGNYFDAQQVIVSATERYSVMGRVDYEISSNLNFNVEVTQAQNGAKHQTASFRDAGATTATVPAGTTSLVARIDNPFLPGSVRTLMQQAGVNAVFVGRDGYGLDISTTDPRVATDVKNLTRRVVAGFDGNLGVGNFTWNAYYQYGRSRQTEYRPGNRIPTRYRLATDVTTNPANGQPICRSTLTDPANGCVPFNIFGANAASDAARTYVTGVATVDAVQSQHVLAAEVQGDLFTLPAGPVAIAAGGEYREERASAKVDAISAASLFEFTNSQPYSGLVKVKEVFGEVGVPLLRDVPGFKSLDANFAGRYTDYSTSGGVVTWKAGLTWEVVDELRLRGTISRDIRAANVSELYAKATGGAFFVPIDRVLNTVSPAPIATITAANPNLDPEKGTTITFGFAYQPNWLRGFRLSVDYFDIDIKGQIARVDGQTVIDRCAQGLADYCGFITRAAGTNVITSVSSAFLNLNRFATNGVDFEISLKRPLSDLSSSLPGDLSLRLLATYTEHLTTTDARGPIDRAGQLTGSATVNSVPHWQGNLTATYEVGRLSTSLQGRFVGAGNIDNLATPGTSTGANIYKVGSKTYWNLSASYDLIAKDGHRVQLFGLVDNVFNSHPPFPFMPSSLVTSPYHTVLERSYRVGVRFAY